MNNASRGVALHSFATGISAQHILRAFRTTGECEYPFRLRHGQGMLPEKIRCSVSYARLVEADRKTQGASDYAEIARKFLFTTLSETKPNPAWSMWKRQARDPEETRDVEQLQAYTTSKILYGLGKQGLSDLKKLGVDCDAATDFLVKATEGFCAPESTVHPFLPLLGFQCLHELQLDKQSRLPLLVGNWADRLLYSAEAELARGRISTIAPVYVLFLLGVLIRAMPDALDEVRINKIVHQVAEATGALPAFSRVSQIRVSDLAVGASAIDVLIYLLESDRCRDAVLQSDSLLPATFDWLAANSLEISPGLCLHRTDVFHDSSHIELWYNCAIVHLVHEYKKRMSIVGRERLLVEFRGAPAPSAFKWSDLKVGGFKWVGGLNDRLLIPAKLARERGQKIEQNGVILFGPPGTSKTSVAESIAASLGNWPIVRIGPGTLLQGGPDHLFAKIDEVFERLTRLSDTVILFDEFELLVLEREKDALHASWLTGLITDVMLPWFKALHDWGRNVYIIATNGVVSIDVAIRRAGRFDFILPVGPPSDEERLVLLHSLLDNFLGAKKWDFGVLNAVFNREATIGEIGSWANEVKAMNAEVAEMNAAMMLWTNEFGKHPQIGVEIYDKFQSLARATTYPPSMR